MFRQLNARASVLVSFLFVLLDTSKALALPAFAIREKAPCELCHANGNAPHLTRYGFMYRRAGYRNPANIGNTETDKDAMHLTDHMAVGVNFDYEYGTNKARGGGTPTPTANQFDARELELWPLVGAFQGNIGVFSEIDASPATASPGTDTAAAGGGASVTHMELVYVKGTSELFFNFRGGLIAPQGFGASDQWLDDGNLPFIDSLTPQYNQDTLLLPLGANQLPQLGSELGMSLNSETYVTLGAYNGFDGSNGLATKSQSTLSPVLNNGYSGGAKDYKVQVDQFIGGGAAVTAVYYKGVVSLLDPTNSEVWRNHYSTWRLYATESVTDSVDLLAGAADGIYAYRNSAPDETGGTFTSPGGFVALNTYLVGHLTTSVRYDYFEYSRFQGDKQRATGGAFMVGVPIDNTLVNFHYNLRRSDVDGLTKNLRAEWRLIF